MSRNPFWSLKIGPLKPTNSKKDLTTNGWNIMSGRKLKNMISLTMTKIIFELFTNTKINSGFYNKSVYSSYNFPQRYSSSVAFIYFYYIKVIRIY